MIFFWNSQENIWGTILLTCQHIELIYFTNRPDVTRQIWCKWLRGAVCNLQEPWISSGTFINSNWPHPDRQMDRKTYISTSRAASSTRESGLQQMNTLPNAKLFKTIKSHDFIIYSTIDPIIYSTTIYHYSILCTSLFQFTCEQCVSS